MFNLLTVIILLPVEYFTNYLQYLSHLTSDLLLNHSTRTFESPLGIIVEPIVDKILLLDDNILEKASEVELLVRV
jgi:hypothetical protein